MKGLKLYCILTIFLNVVCYSKAIKISSELVFQYFKKKDISSIITFFQWNIYESVEFSKNLSRHGIRVSQVDYGNVFDNLPSIDNVKMNRVHHSKIGVVFENNIYDDTNILIDLSMNNFMNASYSWLIYSEEKNMTLATMDNMNLYMDADITLVIDEYSSDLELLDVYNPGWKRGSSVVLKECGSWNKDTQTLSYTCFIGYRPANGLIVRAGVVPSTFYPKSTKIEDQMLDRNNPYIDSVSKVPYALLLYMKDYFNFTIEFVVVTAWDDPGIVSILREDEADIAATSLLFLPVRALSMDSVFQIYLFRSAFIFLTPQYASGINNIFLMPFEDDVWVVIFAAVVVIAFLLALTIWIESSFSGSFCPILLVSALDSLGSLCQQGNFLLPSRASGRIVLFTLLMLSSFFYNYYTSSVVSSLLNGKVDYINNLRELAKSNLEIGIDSLDYARIHFEIRPKKETKYLVDEKIKQQKKDSVKEFYMYPEKGIPDVKKGTLAFHGEVTKLYPLIARTFDRSQICRLKELDIIERSKLSMACNKRSMANTFKIGAMRAVQSGLVARSLKVFRPETPECQAEGEILAVNEGSAAPALLLLVLGAAVATIVLGVELRMYWKTKKNTQE